MQEKQILVTGSNGYVGQYIIKELLKKGYKVIAIAWEHNRSTLLNSPNIKYYKLDLSCQDSEKKLKGLIGHMIPSAIIHLAAILACPDYEKNVKSNLETTRTMIRFCQNNNISRIIYLSSISTKRQRKGPYGKTKLSAEQEIIKSGLDYTVFLPEMIIGRESQGFNRILKNINRFPLIVPLIGAGKYKRNPVYIYDLCRVIVDNLFNKISYKKKYEISCGKEMSFNSFVKLIIKELKIKKICIPVPIYICILLGKFFEKTFKIPPFTSEHVLSLTEDTHLDNNKIIKDLDYKYTDLNESVKKIINEINNEYDYYLQSRPEKIFDI